MLASLADEISDSIIRPRGSFFGQSCFTFRPRSGDGDSCFNLPPSCTAAVWPREGADPAVRMLACGRSFALLADRRQERFCGPGPLWLIGIRVICV